MKLSSVIKALASVCLLCADGFPVLEDGSPEIIGPKHVSMKAHLGDPLFLHCEAFTRCRDDVTLIYWLINGSFSEETDRIVECEESTLEGGAIVKRSLLVKNVTSEDLTSRFTCVVTNAVGITEKHISLSKKKKKKQEKTTKHS